MTNKEEVSKDVLERVEALMFMHNSEPTAEECEIIQFITNDVAERRRRRNESLMITTRSSSSHTVVESMSKEDVETHSDDDEIAEFLIKIGDKERLSRMFPPLEEHVFMSKKRELTSEWLIKSCMTTNDTERRINKTSTITTRSSSRTTVMESMSKEDVKAHTPDDDIAEFLTLIGDKKTCSSSKIKQSHEKENHRKKYYDDFKRRERERLIKACMTTNATERIINKTHTMTTRSSSRMSKEDAERITESVTRSIRTRSSTFPPMEEQFEKAKPETDCCFTEEVSSSKLKRPHEKANRKKIDPPPLTREATPQWLIRLMIRKNNGVLEDNSRKIIDKTILPTDVTPNNNRLSMPLRKIVEKNFLNPAEERIIEEDAKRVHKEGVDAILVASDLREFKVKLKLWIMSTPQYNLCKCWNEVVEACGIEEGNDIRVWSFHANGKLYFALVPLSEQ